jgi:two-component system, chemotaxis family, sensor kinase CheA
MGELDEIIEEFLIESHEGLDQLDQDLVALEERPNDKELLARIFRCAHTIKGTSGFIGLSKLEALTHAGETLLSKLRDGAFGIDPEITSLLLEMVDAIRTMLQAVRANGTDGETEYPDLIERLKLRAQGSVRAAVHAPVIAAAPADLAPSKDDHGDSRAANLESVRVDVELLDSLMDLAGELVLTRNQIMQLQGTLGESALTASSQRLNLVTIGLQEGIMRMRMQPIDHVLSKFPRMVRDVARSCNKLVRLEMDGKDTELDKTLIEAVKDPLTHLLRNAIDHGIEAPEQRTASGKPPEGRILVRAAHRSGQVHIEIIDDGAGIDVSRVRQKAIDKGMLSAERAESMSESELVGLIFLPGFSTADAVTNVSGRGVGMDVVKTNVERIGGAIEIETRPGRGTTFRIKVPLTLAIVPALIVSAGDARYAVPQVSLQELVLVDAERTRQRIEQVHGAPVYRLRDKLLPLVFLNEQLGYQTREECFAKRKVHVAVLLAGGRQFGLVVDRVHDQQEIVVKPLAAALKPINVYSGATILGDGRVVLILDVVGVAQRANLMGDAREEAVGQTKEVPKTVVETTSLLLLRGPDDSRLAVPLERVARLETVPISELEDAGGIEVLQYGSGIMPIVQLSSLLPERRVRPRHAEVLASVPDYVNLVVLSVRGAQLALAVHDILDVVDAEVVLRSTGSRAGVLGTLVIQQRVTELLDLDWVIEQSGFSAVRLEEAV